MDCWYRNVCVAEHEDCELDCIKYTQVKSLFEKSNLPEKLWKPIKLQPDKEDEGEFDFLENIGKNIESWVEDGGNLFIYSGITGNGKTSWAIKLLQKYFNRCWAGSAFRCKGKFVSCSSLALRYKRSITNQDKELDKLINDIRECDLVVWDDIGEVSLTPFIHELFIDLINHRISNNLANIYTSNVIDDDLKTRLGARLFSRVQTQSDIVEFIGEDKRGKRR